MSLTTVPVSLVAFRSANTSANTLNGANVVFIGNTAYSTGMGLYQRRAGLQRGSFVNYEPPPLVAAYSGESYGYAIAGIGPGSTANQLERYSYTSDTNAVQIGSFLPTPTHALMRGMSGTCSTSKGYVVGGVVGSSAPTLTRTGNIYNFPLAGNTNTSDIGQLTNVNHERGVGIGAIEYDYGYAFGGLSAFTISDRYPTVSNGNAVDVNELSAGTFDAGSIQTATDGYVVAGYEPNFYESDKIRKYAFSSETGSTNTGVFISTARITATSQSYTHGYGMGGTSDTTLIQKFPFSADVDSVDTTAELSVPHFSYGAPSTYSGGYGYIAGGLNPAQSPTETDNIQKYNMSSSENSVSVGTLTVAGQVKTGNIQV